MRLELTDHQAEILRDELYNRVRSLNHMEPRNTEALAEIQGRILFLQSLTRKIDFALTPEKES